MSPWRFILLSARKPAIQAFIGLAVKPFVPGTLGGFVIDQQLSAINENGLVTALC